MRINSKDHRFYYEDEYIYYKEGTSYKPINEFEKFVCKKLNARSSLIRDWRLMD